jgi:hypothetical protein
MPYNFKLTKEAVSLGIGWSKREVLYDVCSCWLCLLFLYDKKLGLFSEMRSVR